MSKKRQFQAIAVLSVESDLVKFSVLSLADGVEIASSAKSLPLITDRTRTDGWSAANEPTVNRAQTADYRRPGGTTADPYSPGEDGYVDATDENPPKTTITAKGLTVEPPELDSTAADVPVADDPSSESLLKDRALLRELSSEELAVTGPSGIPATAKDCRNGAVAGGELSSGRPPGLPTGSRPSAMEPGNVEQDPNAIWTAVEQVIDDAVDQMCRDGVPVTYIKSLGVANEMGTLLSWNAETSAPLHNAIHWTDARASKEDGKGAAPVVRWLLARSSCVSRAGKNCRFGTLDAWVLWMLTAGQTFSTDVTNASYTGLLDLTGLDWDRNALRECGLTGRSWPTVRLHGEHAVVLVGRLMGVTVHAVMARPSATLYGHGCRERGQFAVTIDEQMTVALGALEPGPPVRTENGPMPVVGYCAPFGTASDACNLRVVYGLLVVSKAAAAGCWLKNNLRLISSSDDWIDAHCLPNFTERRDLAVNKNWPFMVPALEGLPYVPHNRPDARMIICGITDDTGTEDLIVAAAESLCFSVVDAVQCIAAASVTGALDTPLVDVVYVDGSYSRYPAMMQWIADVSGGRTVRTCDDMAIHGVGRMAAININAAYRNRCMTITSRPKSTSSFRSYCVRLWRESVRRSYGWIIADGRETVNDEFVDPQPTPPTLFSQMTSVLRAVANTCSLFYAIVGNEVCDVVYRLSNAIRTSLADGLTPIPE